MKIPVLGISRHRIFTDGDGITTLVAFYGCPLDCRYCANPQCKRTPTSEDYYTPESLLEAVAADNLYYRATNGGITFGGGEPALLSRFIAEFERICPPEWNITLETSLNVPREHIERLLPVVDSWIVDIKDWNDAIYMAYTGKSNAQAIDNLSFLLAGKGADWITVRAPLIEDYNTKEDTAKTVAELQRMGVSNVEEFTYRTDELFQPDDEIAAGTSGKRICEQLKAVRTLVAREVGIDYRPFPCPHAACATGSCPACDAEVAELSRQLFDNGKTVCVDGIVSRQQLVCNYRFVPKRANDAGGLSDATPDSCDETTESLKPSLPDSLQKCAADALVPPVSSADSNTSAPHDDDRDRISRWSRTLPGGRLTGILRSPEPEQEAHDEDEEI